MRRRVALFAAFLVTAACGGTGAEPSRDGQLFVSTPAMLTSIGQVTRVTVSTTPITASRDLTYNSSNGSFSGTFALPAGSYLVTVDAFVGTVQAGTGSATVTVAIGEVAQVAITVRDTSGPPPVPDHSPVIASLVVPVSSTTVGAEIPLSVVAIDADNDPITYLWTVSPASCGSIAPGASAAPTWTAAGDGTCIIGITVSANGKSDTRSASVVVTNPATGGISIHGTFAPRPVIDQVQILGSGAFAVNVHVYRSDADATVKTPIPLAATTHVYLMSEAYDAAATLASSCGGSLTGQSVSSIGKYVAWNWTTPSIPSVCILTGTLSREGMTDTFPIVVLVGP